jgi:hypothetical protein
VVEWLANYSNLIGNIGVVLILVTYLLLNMNKLSSQNPIYPILNALGSMLILTSLMFNWNLPSVLIEIAWITISCFGVCRTLYLHCAKKKIFD